MAATQEINIDTITPLVHNPIEDSATSSGDSIEVATVAVQSIPTETIATTDSSSSNGWVGWIGVGISVVVGLFAWKINEKLTKQIRNLKQHLSDKDIELSHKFEKIDAISVEIKSLRQSLHSASRQPSARTIEPTVKPNAHNNSQYEEVKPPKRQTLLKYATLQSPDENGILRFSERSMIDSSSSQKMFMLEIDNESGTGIYRINPAAMSLILADLQMFRDFVKPFTFSGNPLNASIQDKVPGKIIRKGNYWVVEEPLEISIH